jgi:hypothetical protein
MMKKTFLSLLAVWVIGVLADSAVQTDWSGGDGIEGPITEWNDVFASSDYASWLSISGQIALSSFPLMEPRPHLVDGEFDGAYGVCSADIDGDGDVDLVGAATRAGEISWWENLDGSGEEWIEHTMCIGFNRAHCVYAADIDGDGDDDVVGAALWGDEVAWWKNLSGDGSRWLKITIDNEFRRPYAVSAGDVDRDGDLDLFGAGETDDLIVWWENADGGGYVWIKHIICDEFQIAMDVCAVDFDHDGDTDVVGAGESHDVSWWENADGIGGSFIQHDLGPIYGRSVSVSAVDVNGDGDTDVVHTGDQYLAWMDNLDGAGDEWESRIIDDEMYGGYSVESADLDGDGDFDAVAADWMLNFVHWWENSGGEGSAWAKRCVGMFIIPRCVHPADVDGDGDLDVSIAVEVEDSIFWFDITAFRPSGELVSSILDTGVSAAWGPLTWDARVPEGTSLVVAVRASDDYGQMGEWSDVPASGTDLTGIIPDGLRYFQYRLSLSTSDTDVSPVLKEITLEWDDASGVGDAALAASPTSEGILVEWNVTGERPAGFKLLRQSADTGLVPVHEGYLPGEAARYLDRGAAPGVEYVYWLEVFDGHLGEGADIFGPSEAVTIPDAGSIPSLSVFPSPADDGLTVTFCLPDEGRIELTVYDLAGRRVTSLEDGVRPAGRNDIQWSCAGTPPGVYLCVLRTAWGTLSRRLVIAR